MRRLIVTAILFLLIGAGVGFMLGLLHKSYPPTYVINSPMTVVSGTTLGTLPVGTRLYYHSYGHGSVVFHVYLRVPENQIESALTHIDTDYYYGYRALEAQ